jgi:PAS domain S-box-containing protein
MSKRRSLPVADDLALPENADKQRLVELEGRLHEMETALQVSSSKLRMALDVGRLGSWERDIATGIVTGTATFKANLGLPSDATLTYEELQHMFHPGDMERVNQAISYAIRTKTDFNVDHRVLRPDGHIGRVLVRGSAVYENDKPVRLVGVTQDVTEREKAKEEVNLAQRRQEFLLSLSDQLGSLDDPYQIMETAARNLAGFLRVDNVGYGEAYLDRRIITVEREWTSGLISNEGRIIQIDEIPGWITEPLIHGQPVITNDVKTDPKLDDPASQAFYSTANIRTVFTVPLVKNGHLKAIVYVSSAAPRNWQSDDVVLVADVAHRTWIAIEKARAEAGLRETEARFKVIAESLPALVWMIDLELKLTYANDRWISFSGLPPIDALGDSWMRWVHPDDLSRVVEDMKLVYREKSNYTTEMRYRSADGVYRWHMVHAAPMLDTRGEVKGWVGTSVDIHDLKEAEGALRTNERQLRIALQAAKMGDWSWDAETDKMTLSTRATEIFGLPPGTPRTWSQLAEQIYPSDAARAHSTMERAAEARSDYSLEYRVTRRDNGVRVWVAAQGQTVFDKNGDFLGMTGVVQDITDRKHAEERQQLLIRELHHRVKNTLATVQAIVGSTARTASSIDEFYQGFVGRIVSLARTHNLLTEDLWQKASLEELIQTELGPYEDEARNRIVIEGPHVELPSEAAVPVGMAIHELTTNAAKHGALSTFGGQVEVKWRIEPGEERPMLQFSWTEHGGPRVTTPSRQGFGSRLLQRVLTTQLQAHVNMDFQEEGLRFTMVMPIPGEPPLFNPDK